MGGGQGDDSLMGVGGRHGVQLPPVHGNHHGACFLGLGGQTLQAPVRIAGSDKEFIDGAAAFQGFLDGVAPLQLPFHFLDAFAPLGETISPAGGGRRTLPRTVFIHNCVSPI